MVKYTQLSYKPALFEVWSGLGRVDCRRFPGFGRFFVHPLKNYPMVSLPLCLKKVKGMCDSGQPKFPAIPDLRVSGNRDVFEELS